MYCSAHYLLRKQPEVVLHIGLSVTLQNRLKSLKALVGQKRSDFSLPNQVKVF